MNTPPSWCANLGERYVSQNPCRSSTLATPQLERERGLCCVISAKLAEVPGQTRVAPEGSALYDRSLDVYLIAYVSRVGIHVRASPGLDPLDKDHRRDPLSCELLYFYPNLIGETAKSRNSCRSSLTVSSTS